MSDTMHQLRHALSRLDEMTHKMSALEERERREQRETRERADHARYLTSREHLLDVQARNARFSSAATMLCSRGASAPRCRTPMSRSTPIAAAWRIRCRSACRGRRAAAPSIWRACPKECLQQF